MRPYHENFLFKRSVHPAHFILGGFGKKQRGIGSLAGGWGKLWSGRPRSRTWEVGSPGRGVAPHRGVSERCEIERRSATQGP